MAFTNRTTGGQQLAARLVEMGVDADLVCAIPRGGLPVGRAVADRLDVPLDVVVASKLGAPSNPELAIGAVAGDGSYWLNDDLVDQLGVSDDYIQQERDTEAEVARQKIADYRGGEPLPDVSGKRVVLVDDGIATEATAMACLRQLQATDATEVILAVPVAPPSARAELSDEADRVVIVDEPRPFQAVGRHYREFGQVTDREAIDLLEQ
ncbi:putative phosphoribosyltransferase [Halohasta litchfieldiae]|uniref:Predicted phosphoribosyltransferase n=1 Tax=Halohasta litchfieldiae TaxID=1073996 RepID=A0A1H6RAK0_9EURY|nr:phosphoribosyltransferase family protein [Halohasta litchfieldiae]ATW88502.1 putative phosphoribosyltransferase [Halohasta litchfieldiae]SEI49557.1 Predicted phosphoribosyltransferase [Halohasta litchfieldiae]